MKTKRHIIALVVSLVMVIITAFCIGCANSLPKSYSYEGVLHAEGGKEMPAFLELKEDGSVKLEYIMTMGAESNKTRTTVTEKGTWSQDSKGVITSIKLEDAGETYDAAISEDGTITIGYSLDFSGGVFTVYLAEVSSQGKNFEFKPNADK